ncbi:hypothetical protein HWD32_gp01 [Gordonia phage Secretariat]|uniref:Uncharacterized protein n=1 Tax=Gordonia phage Secretariat TaxID=2725616 RepID=A0A6M3SVJ6_9CAUD|nr:hypothetical protein HWD32_gp01 [Gordonia phage Secretariat]QJD49579.1 hypothetical protein SEA_SECRETARIAT_1 [Gordonia phage Secretariat]
MGDAMKPTIGRIVHYHSHGTPNGEYPQAPHAAIITAVYPAGIVGLPNNGVVYVGLCILHPTGWFFNQMVPYSDEPVPGSWSWPPHVEDDNPVR